MLLLAVEHRGGSARSRFGSLTSQLLCHPGGVTEDAQWAQHVIQSGHIPVHAARQWEASCKSALCPHLVESGRQLPGHAVLVLCIELGGGGGAGQNEAWQEEGEEVKAPWGSSQGGLSSLLPGQAL